MSTVTNVIISCEPFSEDKISALNLAIISSEPHSHCRPFVEAQQAYKPAGDKRMECSVYLGAFNYLDLIWFRSVVESVWLREEVQVLIKRQDDDKFADMWEKLQEHQPASADEQLTQAAKRIHDQYGTLGAFFEAVKKAKLLS